MSKKAYSLRCRIQSIIIQDDNIATLSVCPLDIIKTIKGARYVGLLQADNNDSMLCLELVNNMVTIKVKLNTPIKVIAINNSKVILHLLHPTNETSLPDIWEPDRDWIKWENA